MRGEPAEAGLCRPCGAQSSRKQGDSARLPSMGPWGPGKMTRKEGFRGSRREYGLMALDI